METPANQSWFLRKYADGSVFGPLSFDQLALWAADAQIAPHDAISTDQQTWIKAPMLPQLEMDWLVEVTNEHYYGPTTLGALEEFIRLGEINEETFVINACDGTRRQIQEMPALSQSASDENGAPEIGNEPATAGMSIRLQERIRELEQILRQERSALAESEQRYQELERKYTELLQMRLSRIDTR
jgi:hypothetical protein